MTKTQVEVITSVTTPLAVGEGGEGAKVQAVPARIAAGSAKSSSWAVPARGRDGGRPGAPGISI